MWWYVMTYGISMVGLKNSGLHYFWWISVLSVGASLKRAPRDPVRIQLGSGQNQLRDRRKGREIHRNFAVQIEPHQVEVDLGSGGWCGKDSFQSVNPSGFTLKWKKKLILHWGLHLGQVSVLGMKISSEVSPASDKQEHWRPTIQVTEKLCWGSFRLPGSEQRKTAPNINGKAVEMEWTEIFNAA